MVSVECVLNSQCPALWAANRLLARFPSQNGADFFGRQGWKDQVRIQRLPGERFCFVDGKLEQMLVGLQLLRGLVQDRFFHASNLRQKLSAETETGDLNVFSNRRAGATLLCAILFHTFILFHVTSVVTPSHKKRDRQTALFWAQAPDVFTALMTLASVVFSRSHSSACCAEANTLSKVSRMQ